MTPEMIASEIKKRWKEVGMELMSRKRFDPTVYEQVVSTLAHFSLAEDRDGEDNG
jgi:hypothetical protein